MKYDLVAQSSESTVVAEYNPPQREGAGYQSESELERELIRYRLRLMNTSPSPAKRS